MQHELTIAYCEDGSMRIAGVTGSSAEGTPSGSSSGSTSTSSSGGTAGLAVSGVELSGDSVRAEVDGQQLRAAWCLGR